MSYRKIPPNKILKFSGTPGFKGWKDYFTDESTTHPAKMNLRLLRHILEAHTRPGDVVLDSMAGTGSTVVLASMLGRNGIAVEYEPQFCDMIKENIKRAEKQTTLTSKGSMVCIQGDARELSKLLKESDVIITSPPYGAAQSGGGIAVKGYDGPKHSPTDLVGKRSYMPDKFEKEDNIGVLEYGDVDAVITSPPYEATCHDGRDVKRRIERLKEAGHDPKDFIGGQSRNIELKNYDKVDAVVTSPPYEASVKRGDEGPSASGKDNPTYDERIEQPNVYSNDPDNIGNLKSESYLEAMLQCYREFFSVLKEGGTMVLVVKNFIRDKQVVRLDLDTIRLAEAVGFTLKDHWYFKLPTKSFWRLLYEKKYPSAPKLLYEDVLIFGKGIER